MARKMRPYRAVDASFYANAPLRVVTRRSFSVSAAQAFATLLDSAAWAEWNEPIRSCRWTSPEPLGVGTTRIVELRTGEQIEEEFLVWADGDSSSEGLYAMGFYVRASSSRAFRAFAEEMRFVPTGPSSCALEWTFAVDPSPLVGVIMRMLRGPMGRYFGRLAKRLEASAVARYAE